MDIKPVGSQILYHKISNVLYVVKLLNSLGNVINAEKCSVKYVSLIGLIKIPQTINVPIDVLLLE